MKHHLDIHTIGFRRKMITCPNDYQRNSEDVENLQYLLMRFGYILSSEAADKLACSETLFIEQYANSITELLEEMIGSSRGYTLLDIYELDIPHVRTSLQSHIDLIYIDKFEVKAASKEGLLTEEFTHFTVIEYATETEFKSIFTNLVMANTSITPTDFKIVEWFAETYGSNNIMPKEIPFKENLCMLAALMMDVPVKTSTDVLRIAMYLSNGHTELRIPKKMIRKNAWSSFLSVNPEREKFKFKSFTRVQRKYLLGLLNEVAQEKEMVLKIGIWLRLGERIHPGDYKNKFPRAYKAYFNLRNNPVYSWYSDLNKEMSKGLERGLDKLSERPGEFARRLDALIRNSSTDKTELILTKFTGAASKVSSKVLWELYSHFNKRSIKATNRFINIPGARRPVSLDVLEPMDEELVDRILHTILEILKDRFAELDPLGNVYIDEELKKIPIPTNMRTLSDSLHTYIRGTKIPLHPKKNILRMFLYWEAGVDLDLSATFYKEVNKLVCSYSYTKPTKYISHSGDVIPSKKGKWREFIDINLNENKYDHAILTVRNFSGGSLSSTGAKAGIASFDSAFPSENWLASAVETSYNLDGEGSSTILLAIDFKKREWLLIDQDQSGIPVECMQDSSLLLSHFMDEPKLSAYDVMELHASSRGHQVTNKEEADILFMYNDFSTSYEKLVTYML